MKRHLISEKLDLFHAAVKRWAAFSKGQKKTIALVSIVSGLLVLLAASGAQLMLGVPSVIPFPYAWATQVFLVVATLALLEFSSRKNTNDRGDK